MISGSVQSPLERLANACLDWSASSEETGNPRAVLRPRVRPARPARCSADGERPLPAGPARAVRGSGLGRDQRRGGGTGHHGDVAAQIRPTATARESIAGEGHQGPLMTEHPTEQPLHRATPPAFHDSGSEGVGEAPTSPHWSWICWIATVAGSRPVRCAWIHSGEERAIQRAMFRAVPSGGFEEQPHRWTFKMGKS